MEEKMHMHFHRHCIPTVDTSVKERGVRCGKCVRWRKGDGGGRLEKGRWAEWKSQIETVAVGREGWQSREEKWVIYVISILYLVVPDGCHTTGGTIYTYVHHGIIVHFLRLRFT